jgi:hypothetical protein
MPVYNTDSWWLMGSCFGPSVLEFCEAMEHLCACSVAFSSICIGLIGDRPCVMYRYVWKVNLALSCFVIVV